MTWLDYAVIVLLFTGVFFYAAGSLGLVRFPDAPSRLHALTKADNVGLGLVALATALHWGSPAIAAKIFAAWLFAIMAAGMTAQLLARAAKDDDEASDPP